MPFGPALEARLGVQLGGNLPQELVGPGGADQGDAERQVGAGVAALSQEASPPGDLALLAVGACGRP